MTEAPLLYRFTVKCDRDTNREIERLAKACNISAQAYVQKHFETIMSGEASSAAPEPPAPSVSVVNTVEPKPVAPPKPARTKKRHPGDRILRALNTAKRADGIACVSQPSLSYASQTSIPTLIKYLDELIKDGSIEIASAGQKGRPTAYRILKAPEGDA